MTYTYTARSRQPTDSRVRLVVQVLLLQRWCWPTNETANVHRSGLWHTKGTRVYICM